MRKILKRSGRRAKLGHPGCVWGLFFSVYMVILIFKCPRSFRCALAHL